MADIEMAWVRIDPSIDKMLPFFKTALHLVVQGRLSRLFRGVLVLFVVLKHDVVYLCILWMKKYNQPEISCPSGNNAGFIPDVRNGADFLIKRAIGPF